MKKIFCILSFLLLCLSASAQLHIGAFGEVNRNFLSYDKGYYGNQDALLDEGKKAIKYRYRNKISEGGYLSFRYDFNSWLALRTDLEFLCLCSEDNFWIESPNKISQVSAYKYLPSILLPVMGCAHLHRGRWDFYECPGFYGGYNIDNGMAYKNWDFGFVNCTGLGYRFFKNWSVNAEVKYYHGFLNQHETGSKYFKQPMYNQFVEFAAGVSYTINFK